MIEIIFPTVALLGGLLGTIHDLRTREVPDWINYFMIIFGIGGHIILSISNWSVWPFLQSFGGALLFYGIAALMFYSGQWGGGDAKMLIGFGALLPIYPTVLLKWFNPVFSFWPFIVTLFLNIILIGGALGLAIMLFLIAKNIKEFSEEMKFVTNKYKNWVRSVFLVLMIPAVMYFLDKELFLASVISWGVILLLLLSFLAAKAIESTCMIKTVPPSKLTIGDWLAKEIRISNKMVFRSRGTGLTKEELVKLVKLERQGILKEVQIRSGIPFIPSFFLGLLASLVLGDLIFIIIGNLI